MKFTVNQSALAEAVGIVWKNMGSNSNIAILSGIYLKAENGVLELQTNNLITRARHRIPANVEEPGETVVSGKTMTNIVRLLPDAGVTFNGGERSIHVQCGRATFRLNTLPAEEWDQFMFPELSFETIIELPSDLLRRMVDKVYRSVSKDQARPILTGINLTLADNTITLVATDSYRLSVCDSHVASTESINMVVQGQLFHEILSLPNMTETLRIGVNDTHIYVSFGNTEMIISRIEGMFPNIKQILPTSSLTALTIKRDEFEAAIKRVCSIDTADKTVRLDINVEDQTMRISKTSIESGEASETLGFEIEGESCQIGLDYRNIQDGLASMSEKNELRFELQTSKAPCVFKVNGEINYLYLMMPIRM